MQNISIRKAQDLSGSVRTALESLLGRALGADEMVSVRAYPPHEAPSGTAREGIARDLEKMLDERAEKVKEVPEQELEAAIEEAMNEVRPRSR